LRRRRCRRNSSRSTSGAVHLAGMMEDVMSNILVLKQKMSDFNDELLVSELPDQPLDRIDGGIVPTWLCRDEGEAISGYTVTGMAPH
jgi:hypothetical protein